LRHPDVAFESGNVTRLFSSGTRDWTEAAQVAMCDVVVAEAWEDRFYIARECRVRPDDEYVPWAYVVHVVEQQPGDSVQCDGSLTRARAALNN
jgi:hypothetical protein